jgi:energy-coupling factor transporter transmembrane protein EcfT
LQNSAARFVFSISLATSGIFSNHYGFLALLLGISVSSLLLWKTPLPELVKFGKYSLAFAAIVFLLHLFSHDAQIIARLWFLHATVEGAGVGLLYALKLLIFAYSGYIIFASVDPFDLLSPLEKSSRHLGVVGHFVASSALAFFIALRFIPDLVQRGRMASLALKSRGLDSKGSIREKARFAVFLIAPLFAGAIKSASMVSTALDIKGYGTRYHKAIYEPAKVRLQSVILSLLSAGLLFLGWKTI